MMSGLGYTHELAASLLLVFAAVSVGYGPWVGWFCARFTQWRLNLVIGCIVLILLSVLVIALTPGRLPTWAVVILFALIGTGGPTSMVAFDISRTAVEHKSLGAANGFINVGGFIASLSMMGLVGLVIDLRQRIECAGQTCGPLFSLDHFKTAFGCELIVVVFGLTMLWLSKKRASIEK